VPAARRATGPGRVNLIGDHTDYNHGVALPMAIGLGVTVDYLPGDGGRVLVSSAVAGGPGGPVTLDAAIPARHEAIAAIEPEWARLVAAMVAVSPTGPGGHLRISGSLPMGAGLSSSAALCVAMAEVLAAPGTDAGPARAVARRCQQAEQLAGRPVGAMDPLACAGAAAGHALLIDFPSLDSRAVAIPPEADVVVVDSGQRRSVASSEYATRVDECAAAARVIGPLGLARPGDLGQLNDPLLRRRARHVVGECARVRHAVAALESCDLVTAGRLMSESHASLADDFQVSTPRLDDLVASLAALPGVLGARLTGAGFGGCVVALCRAGAVDPSQLGSPAWLVHASDGTVAGRGGPGGGGAPG
jgi:galactokinase